MCKMDILVPEKVYNDFSKGMEVSEERSNILREDLTRLIASRLDDFKKSHEITMVELCVIYGEEKRKMMFKFYNGNYLNSITVNLLWFVTKFGKPEKIFIKLEGTELRP